jgi:hypothetical protein
MSELEFLDIYDEDMNYLGKATRGKHTQKGCGIQPFSEYRLQKEEVKGLISIKICDFEDLINERLEKIIAKGIEFNEKNQLDNIDRITKLQDFVPHGHEYYSKIISSIKNL